MKIDVKLGTYSMLLFIIAFIVAYWAYAQDIKLQGNHDTTVELQGNHDTTVAVRKELCEAVIADRFGDKLEGDNQSVKMHTIAGADGSVVAKVIIMYKEFPIVLKLEEEK